MDELSRVPQPCVPPSGPLAMTETAAVPCTCVSTAEKALAACVTANVVQHVRIVETAELPTDELVNMGTALRLAAGKHVAYWHVTLTAKVSAEGRGRRKRYYLVDEEDTFSLAASHY
jgi:hypothetical protein